MTYKIRKSAERKYVDHGWLKTYHTFSFADYYDPNFMGFRDLRVINEDRIAPGHGFPLHEHRNMEILSVVIEGDLAHQDSTGTESILHTNEVQAMSAGSGITHSEYNPSNANLVHFLQIWIVPDTKEITPQYQQIKLPSSSNQWVLIASKSAQEGSLQIQQDVSLYALSLESNHEITRKVPPNRYGWLQVINGELAFNDELLKAGDGVAIDPDTHIKLKAHTPSRILFFDLK